MENIMTRLVIRIFAGFGLIIWPITYTLTYFLSSAIIGFNLKFTEFFIIASSIFKYGKIPVFDEKFVKQVKDNSFIKEDYHYTKKY